MTNLITEMHDKHKQETAKPTMVRESHDPIALFLGIVVFVITMIGTIVLPLAVNHAWIGLVEVVWFFVGFSWTGKLMEVKNRHNSSLIKLM